jgi:hypothetical protein
MVLGLVTTNNQKYYEKGKLQTKDDWWRNDYEIEFSTFAGAADSTQ